MKKDLQNDDFVFANVFSKCSETNARLLPAFYATGATMTHNQLRCIYLVMKNSQVNWSVKDIFCSVENFEITDEMYDLLIKFLELSFDDPELQLNHRWRELGIFETFLPTKLDLVFLAENRMWYELYQKGRTIATSTIISNYTPNRMLDILPDLCAYFEKVRLKSTTPEDVQKEINEFQRLLLYIVAPKDREKRYYRERAIKARTIVEQHLYSQKSPHNRYKYFWQCAADTLEKVM